jgi:hypothetical protein
MLSDGVLTSEPVNSVSLEAELFFHKLIVVCDDFGRMDARAVVLLARCYPLRLDTISASMVYGWLADLARAGLIQLYEAEGKQYLAISKWDEHQRIRAKHSKFPAPPPQSAAIRRDSPQNAPVVREARSEKREARKKHEAAPAGEPLVLHPVSPKGPGDHRAFVEWFDAAYQAHHGASPSWGKKQGEWVKQLLKAHGLAEAIRRAEIMFSPGCPDWIAKGGRSLGTLVSQFDNLAQPAKHGKPEVVDEQFRADARRLGLPIDGPDPPETGSLLLPPIKSSRYTRST